MPVVRSYNPVEGGPAIWLEHPIKEPAQVTRLVRQLRESPAGTGPIDIVIDGPGGRAGLGLEMYAAIREALRPTRVTIFHAASMHGVVAMAATERRIVEGGTFHLHGAGYGKDHLLNEIPVGHIPATALRAMARNCDATDAAHVAIFSARAGLDPAEVGRLRDADTTLAAADALRLGFVHEIVTLK